MNVRQEFIQSLDGLINGQAVEPVQVLVPLQHIGAQIPAKSSHIRSGQGCTELLLALLQRALQRRSLNGLEHRPLEPRLRRLMADADEDQRPALFLGARRLVDPFQMGSLFKAMALTSKHLPLPPPFSSGEPGDSVRIA